MDFTKLSDIQHQFQDIERRMSDPEIISDQSTYQDLVKKHTEMKEIVDVFKEYESTKSQISDSESLLEDPEMKEMAAEEIAELSSKLTKLEDDLQVLLLPKDPNDKRNALIEIRSGTGGDEAALFAYDLFRMYTKFSEKNGWKTEIFSETATGIGGLKEISFLISGTGVYSQLKFESGTHRVQRVPDTEASGRVHTSAATVAILPEAEDVDIEIDQKDLRIDVYRASGAGGQHVNKTSSAVRITHVPTGIAVACQDERSQFQNKDKAMRTLKTKLYDLQVQEKQKEAAQLRKNQVGSGDRSEKIRTYNFPQNRVTDHRINLTLHSLTDILDGDLEPVVEALITADRMAQMQEQ